MEPEPKFRNFFGTGSSQKGRLRNSAFVVHYFVDTLYLQTDSFIPAIKVKA